MALLRGAPGQVRTKVGKQKDGGKASATFSHIEICVLLFRFRFGDHLSIDSGR